MRTLAVSCLLVALAIAVPVSAAAYPWPVEPFDRQHAIRGNFGDPRTLRGSIDAAGWNPLSFHSGVDIQAPDGTPVYAVEGGEVAITEPYAIAVGTPDATPSAVMCAITVYYKSGPSHAQGLYPKRPTSTGRVSWTWMVGTRTTPGRWAISVSCGRAGTLNTSFVVR